MRGSLYGKEELNDKQCAMTKDTASAAPAFLPTDVQLILSLSRI